MYTWKDLCPLTAEEALRVHRKGLRVLALSSVRSFIIKDMRDIRRHAKRDRIFAVNKDELLRSETHYVANYTIVVEMDGSHNVIAEKAYKTRDEAKDDCKRLLAQTMLRNGICADGQYWVVYELNRYLFGDFNGLDEMDEGEITMKNKVVTDVPAGFWLPF